MRLRTILNQVAPGLVALFFAATTPAAPQAQDRPAKRLAGIVGVAVDEYAKGIDDRGRLTSQAEYDEALGFLADARDVAGRMSGGNTAQVRMLVDSLIAAMRARVPPQSLTPMHERFVMALGREGALDLPSRLVDVAAGAATYARNCTPCHGINADGRGPLAASFAAPPPPIGDARAMHDVSPANMYRIVSVGVSGTPMAGWASTLSPDQRWEVVTYVASLRASPAQVARGERLYHERCAGCRVRPGLPPITATADAQLPPEMGAFGWAAERSDAQLAVAIRDAGAGRPSGVARTLGDSDIAAVIAYVRMLPARDASTLTAAPQAAVSADEADVERTARRVMALLDEALAAANAGRTSDAGDKAFDAYLAFEPLETTARAKEPSRVTAMERHFAEFKGAVRLGDVAGAEAARNAVELGLPAIVALSRPMVGWWEVFGQSLLIILREGFEAILVIGAVIAFLVKMGHRERVKAVWYGVVWALVASAATAVVLSTVLRAIPASRELVEGVTLLVAVAVLFSVSYWLISKVEAAKWQQFIRAKVTEAIEHGGGMALAFVGFLAVYREGAETALFYQALFQQSGDVAMPLALGVVAGFAGLAVIFTLFYRFGVRIPMRPFFTITSALLYSMAFVFMGKGIRELQEANAVPLTVWRGWPTVDVLGIFPSKETMLAQALLIVLLSYALWRTFGPKRAPDVPAAAPAADTVVPQHVHIDLEGRVAELTAKATVLQERLKLLEAELARGKEPKE